MGCCSNKQNKSDSQLKAKRNSIHKNTQVFRKQSQVDKNGNRSNSPYLSTQKELKSLVFQFFDIYDTNHDGFLDKGQAQCMLNELYSHTKNQKHLVTNKEVDNFLRALDSNEDRLINRDELYLFYKSQMM